MTALVLGRVLAAAPVPILVLDGQLARRALEHDLLLLRRQLLPRLVEIEIERIGDRFEHPLEVLGVRAAPRRDGALADRLLGVGHHELGVDLERGAQTVAGLARAIRRVEREVARRRFLVRPVADRAGEVLAEGHHLGFQFAHDLDLCHAVGQRQRGLERVGESPLDPLAQHEPVDDDLDLVLLVAGEALVALQELVDDDGLAVDPGAHVALTRQVGEQRVVLALAPAYNGREHLEAGALGQLEDPVDDLLGVSGVGAGCRRQDSVGCRSGRTAGGGSRRPR